MKFQGLNMPPCSANGSKVPCQMQTPQIKHIYIRCLQIHCQLEATLSSHHNQSSPFSRSYRTSDMTQTRNGESWDKSASLSILWVQWGTEFLAARTAVWATALAFQTRKFSLMIIQQNLMPVLPSLCLIKIWETAFEHPLKEIKDITINYLLSIYCVLLYSQQLLWLRD